MNLNLPSSSFDIIISCLLPAGCLILIRSQLRLNDDHKKLLWVANTLKITKNKAQHGIPCTSLTGRKYFFRNCKKKRKFYTMN